MDNNELLKLAGVYGTPAYIFDCQAFARRCRQVKEAIGEAKLCYCVKANGFLVSCLPSEIELLEVCSPGELELCKRAGISPRSVLLSGLNKAYENITDAIDFGVEAYTAESYAQLLLLNKAGIEAGIRLPTLLRLTAGDQFGMDETDLRRAASSASDLAGVRLVGIHYFAGTQRSKADKAGKELDMLIALADSIKKETGIDLNRLEYGPGLMVDYFGRSPGLEEELLSSVAPHIQRAARRFDMTVELGRFLSADCGVYITRVCEIKTNHGQSYAIVDGGNHQLHYDGQSFGLRRPPVEVLLGDGPEAEYTICGSLCAISDRLVQNITLPKLEEGSLLLFRKAGGYCAFEGTALFLSRELPRVVLRHGDGHRLVRDFVQTNTFNGV